VPSVDEWAEATVAWARGRVRTEHLTEFFRPLVSDPDPKRAREKIARIRRESEARIRRQESPNARLLWDILLAGNLAGRAEARQSIRSFAEQPPLLDPDLQALLYVFDFHRPPREAIDFLLSKRIVSYERFLRLMDELRPYAFSLAAAADLKAMRLVLHLLEDALAEGEPFTLFFRRLQAVAQPGQFDRMTARYWETVFRNNVNTALNAGRWAQYHEEEAAEIIVYKTMSDSRVRPTHRAMHNFAAPIDDRIWEIWWPPNGHNCRCKVIAMSRDVFELRSRRVSYKRRWPSLDGRPVRPDPGWEGVPKVGRR
jgi:SPP1 gp7 family putative phage head morphogenesis protein